MKSSLNPLESQLLSAPTNFAQWLLVWYDNNANKRIKKWQTSCSAYIRAGHH